ncbi:MAG TPA: lantibiotic dehydratase, partial [Steroidobacteraceae bacterium]|nr:lantibiotic dehydratase [Steroidobacteraceae bacterium]
LSTAIARYIEESVTVVQRITPVRNEDALKPFRDVFRNRYGERWLPLMEVLDADSGIGFPVGASSVSDDAPLLAGFLLDRSEPIDSSWNQRDVYLLKRLHTLLATQQTEWQLSDEDMRTLDEGVSARQCPDAVAVAMTLTAADEAAIERGEYKIEFGGCFGPPGVRMAGRFCYGDDELNAFTQSHLRREEAYRPDVIYAELVHLPQGRSGNMIVRPVLRDYEIPFLGRSGAAIDKQIALTDLLVSVVEDRVVLYSKTHRKEIVPRLTSALSFATTLGVNQFLGALDRQHMQNWMGWSWGKLINEKYLPRVTYDRLVLSKAAWTVDAAEFKTIINASGTDRFRLAQAWRQTRKLPRFCALVENENEMLLDLDNILSLDSFCDLVKKRTNFKLEECFLSDEHLPVHSTTCGATDENSQLASYTHEIVVPLLRVQNEQNKAPRAITPDFGHPVVTDAAPGSEWLYFKLYGGEGATDAVLCEAIAPAVTALKELGAIDSWFFIRYADPDSHLRVRLHGEPSRLCSEALPEIHQRLSAMVGGQLWRVELGTYQREIERYGGIHAINHAERLFEVDSDAALAITSTCRGDEGAVYRWQLALVGADRWLRDFGFDINERRAFARSARDAYAKEMHADGKQIQGWYAERYRKERPLLEPLIAAMANMDFATEQPDLAPALVSGLNALIKRSSDAAPTLAELYKQETNGALNRSRRDIAHSLIHMYCNRVLRSEQRVQEMVIYEFLTRLYDSEWARGRAGNDVAATRPHAYSSR